MLVIFRDNNMAVFYAVKYKNSRDNLSVWKIGGKHDDKTQFYTILQQHMPDCKQSVYPDEIQISSENDFRIAVSHDHVCVRYKNNHRKKEHFIQSDCIMFDIDNSDSDNPSDWIYPNIDVCQWKHDGIDILVNLRGLNRVLVIDHRIGSMGMKLQITLNRNGSSA